MKLNKNDKRRQEILGLDVDWDGKPNGGCASFDNATVGQVRTLLDEKFADPNDAQNESPTYQEIIDFMELYPDFTAHGYIVSPKRGDYRVTIEGVQLDRKPTSDEIVDFTHLFRHADEFDTYGRCYCWFD